MGGVLQEELGSRILKEEERTKVLLLLFASSAFLSLSHIKLFYLFKPWTDGYTTNKLV